MRGGTGLLMALGGLAIGLLGPSQAEQREPLAKFFENAPPASPAARPERRPPRPTAPPSATAAVSAARRPASTAVRSDFVVGVFGDAFAASVARGLNDGGSADLGRTVIDATADDASVVSVDAATWDKAIDGARQAKGRLDAAVLMVGRQDSTALTDSHGQRVEPGSAAWQQLYGDRVAAIADRFRDKHVPLIWVGLPIVRDAGDAQLYATLNEVVHDRAPHEGATFVDTWQAFADENGDFSPSGPDVDGHPATLRWTNGWNFTRAGARKLASFTLPDLKRVRDRMTSNQELAAVPAANPDSFDQALDIDVNAQILREAGLPAPAPKVNGDSAAAAALEAGPVLVLTAAPQAADGRLASIEPDARPPSADATPAPHPGRADDFAWPGP